MTNSGEVPRLSYSSIDTYERCPLQYRYRYVERLEFEPKPALSFGSSLHAALEWFYDVKTTHPPELDALLDKLKETWVSEGYADAAEEGRYLEEGLKLLTDYYYKNVGSFRVPVSLEEYFEVDLGGFVLTGKIDRVDRDPGGTYEIIDYKTNRNLPPRERLAANLQLPIYQYAALQKWGISAGKLTLYYLRPGQRYSTRPWDEKRIAAMLERLRGVAGSITSGAFEPTPNNLCGWCDFTALCPCDPGAERGLARLVDRYADLERRRMNLERLLDGLAGELDEAWPGEDETVHSRKNAVRRRPGENGPRFSLEP